jgi:hypothetical protein
LENLTEKAMSELTSYQIDFIKESGESKVKLAARFGMTPNQIKDVQDEKKPREKENFVLGRGPGTQAAVDAILAGGPTPLGPILDASGFTVDVVYGEEVKVPYGPRGQDYIDAWEELFEPAIHAKNREGTEMRKVADGKYKATVLENQRKRRKAGLPEDQLVRNRKMARARYHANKERKKAEGEGNWGNG